MPDPIQLISHVGVHQKQNSSLEPKHVNLAYSFINEPDKHFLKFFFSFFYSAFVKTRKKRGVTWCEGGETINATNLKRNLIYRYVREG